MYLFKKIKYDEIGNPTTYRDKTLEWSHGRRLDRFDNVEFKYNVNGIRTSKKVGEKETKFFLSGTKILAMQEGENMLNFFYGADGVTGFTFNNEDYYYKKNAQNDIISIYSTNGEEIIRYFYDAWGNFTTQTIDNGNELEYTKNESIARLNPFRYRSYCYDEETNLYYLNSRYYDPETCRFINADDISALNVTQIATNGLNLFAYCLNNPVNTTDEYGNLPKWLAWLISGLAVVAGAILVATGIGGPLGGALIAGGVGSIINGYINESNGNSFTAGWVGGLVSGAICGLGAGVAGGLILNATKIVGLKAIGMAVGGYLISFATGFAGNIAGDLIISGIDKKQINWFETLKNSTIIGGLNIFAGIGSAMASVAQKAGKTIAYKVLTSLVTFGSEAIFDLASFVWNKISKLFS